VRSGVSLGFIMFLLALVLLNVLMVFQSTRNASYVNDMIRSSGIGWEKFSRGLAERLEVTCVGEVCCVRSFWGGVSRLVRVTVVKSDGEVVTNGAGVFVPPYGNATLRIPSGSEYVFVVTGYGNVFSGYVQVSGREVFPGVWAPIWLHFRSVDVAFLSTLDLGYAVFNYARYGFSDHIENYGEVIAWGKWLIGGTATPLRSYYLVMRTWGYPVIADPSFKLTDKVILYHQVPAEKVVGSLPKNLKGIVTASVAVVGNGTYYVFPDKYLSANWTVAALNVVPLGGESVVATFGLRGLPLAFVGGGFRFVNGDYFRLPVYTVGSPVINGSVYGYVVSSGRSYVVFVNSSAVRFVECDYWKVRGGDGTVLLSISNGTQYVVSGEVVVTHGNTTIGRYMVQFLTSKDLKYGGLNASFVGDKLLVRWSPWRVGRLTYRFAYVVVGVPDYGHVLLRVLRWCSFGVCDFDGLRVWGVRV